MKRRLFLQTCLGASVLPAFPLVAYPQDDPAELFEMRVAPNLVMPLFGKGETVEQIIRLRADLNEYGVSMPKLRIREFSYLDDDQIQILIAGRSIALRDLSGIPDRQDAILHSLKKVVISHQYEFPSPRTQRESDPNQYGTVVLTN